MSRGITDPRNDQLVRQPWDAMSECLRAIVRGLDAPESVRDALRAVIDLHIAWEHYEQLYDGSGADLANGVGCRMCDHMPNLVGNPQANPWCSTIEALRVALTEDGTNLHVVPADQADQALAWHKGYQASRANEQALINWREAGGPNHSPGPAFVTCPYDIPAPARKDNADDR